ncbi:MAG: DUF3450 domain-containing protein [Cellvibrionales bacterium]|nr:DUF3450 domain-containing protein [Cellvibrionales bacterium]
MNHFLSGCLLAMTLSSSLLTHASSLESVNKTLDNNAYDAKASQRNIDTLSTQTESIEQTYRQRLKLLEDLKVYNKKLDIQTKKQEEQLVGIEKSIANVQVIQRQITPLTVNMIDGISDFIELDMPFHKAQREKSVDMLRANVDRPDLTTAEKFRQVLEVYKIESEYGRKIDTYTDTLKIEGVEREVTMLRVGRVALVYQTADMQHTGMWDNKKRQYVALNNSYKDAVRKGIRIANKQANIDILELPIAAPEAK